MVMIDHIGLLLGSRRATADGTDPTLYAQHGIKGIQSDTILVFELLVFASFRCLEQTRGMGVFPSTVNTTSTILIAEARVSPAAWATLEYFCGVRVGHGKLLYALKILA